MVKGEKFGYNPAKRIVIPIGYKTAIHLSTSAHQYNLYGKREKGTSIPHKTGRHTRPRHLSTSAHRYNPYGKREKGTSIPHKTGRHARARHFNTSAHRYNPYGKREKGTSIPCKTSRHTRPRHLNTSAHRYNPHGKRVRVPAYLTGRLADTQGPNRQQAETLTQSIPVSEFYHTYVVFYQQGSGTVLHTSTKSVPSVYHLSNIHECHPFTWRRPHQENFLD